MFDKAYAFVILFLIATAGLTVTSAQAAVILDVQGGQLVGAQNIDVGGTLSNR